MGDLLLALLPQHAHRQHPSPANVLKHHLQIHLHLLPHLHLWIHLKPHTHTQTTLQRTAHRHMTLHIVMITHIIDIVGTIPHRGIALRGQTLPHHDAATTLLTEKAAPETLTAKQPRAIDILIAIPTERAGDLYIHEDHA